MDDKMQKVIDSFTDGSFGGFLDDEAFAYRESIKYAITVLLDYAHLSREEQVKTIMDFKPDGGITRAGAYKLISEAMDIYPSMEKVNKEFERARIMRYIYKYLELCKEKNNTRDAAQYLKLLIQVAGLDKDEQGDKVGTLVFNMFKSDPDSLGVVLPKNFEINRFIQKLEGEYEQRNNTIDIEHSEV